MWRGNHSHAEPIDFGVTLLDNIPRREIISFIAVGFVGLVTDVGTFNLGIYLGLRPLVASLLAFVLAATVSFVFNRMFTFTDRHVRHVGLAYTVFVGINVCAVLLVQLVVWAAEVWEVSLLTLNILRLFAIGVVTIGRFFAYRKWVFVAGNHGELESERVTEAVVADERAA